MPQNDNGAPRERRRLSLANEISNKKVPRQLPRLTVDFDFEGSARARLDCATYEDEMRLRRYVTKATIARMIDAALADLDRRAA